MTTESRITFVRHGEHISGVDNAPLTPRGVEEGRILANKVRHQPENTIGIGFPSLRSLSTLALALYPLTDQLKINALVHRLSGNGVLITPSLLNYIPHNNSAFKEGMDLSAKEGQGLRFLVTESDNYSNSDEIVSCYSQTAYQVACLIAKHINGGSSTPDRDTAKGQPNLLLCTREFVYPSFRAKITEISLGQEALDDYVSWYGANQELVDSARTDVAEITIKHNDGNVITTQLTDTYGTMDVNYEDIEAAFSAYASD